MVQVESLDERIPAEEVRPWLYVELLELLRDIGDYSEESTVDKALAPARPLGKLVWDNPLLISPAMSNTGSTIRSSSTSETRRSRIRIYIFQ